jgi:hypothetical protein
MIWFIFDLGIGLATFVVWVVAFFREPEAGLRARSRPWSSSETPPCSFPAGPRGREMSSLPSGPTILRKRLITLVITGKTGANSALE